MHQDSAAGQALDSQENALTSGPFFHPPDRLSSPIHTEASARWLNRTLISATVFNVFRTLDYRAWKTVETVEELPVRFNTGLKPRCE